MIQKVVDRASKVLMPCYDAIGEKASENDVNHVDETSWFQNGGLHWLWVMANCSVAYFMIHKNRSKQAFLELIQEKYGHSKRKRESFGGTNTLLQADLSDAVVTLFSITSEGHGFVFQRAGTRFVLDLIKVITPVIMYDYSAWR